MFSGSPSLEEQILDMAFEIFAPDMSLATARQIGSKGSINFHLTHNPFLGERVLDISLERKAILTGTVFHFVKGQRIWSYRLEYAKYSFAYLERKTFTREGNRPIKVCPAISNDSNVLKGCVTKFSRPVFTKYLRLKLESYDQEVQGKLTLLGTWQDETGKVFSPYSRRNVTTGVYIDTRWQMNLHPSSSSPSHSDYTRGLYRIPENDDFCQGGTIQTTFRVNQFKVDST